MRHINIHTLKVSVVEVVEGTVVVVAIKVTKQVATERILAGREIIDPLAEETHSSRSRSLPRPVLMLP